MKRLQLINLYNTIAPLKSGAMDKESMFVYLTKIRLPLKHIQEDFEEKRTEFSEQTKPENWKDGDDNSEWNNKFSPLIQKYLDEEIATDLKLLSEDAIFELLRANPDLEGYKVDLIVDELKK